MRSIIKNKRSQAELITTVLLILVAIAAVWLVSTFVIKLITDYLKPTDCFKTTGQLTVNLDGGYTYYDTNAKTLHLSISRGEAGFNLSGISVIMGDGASSKKVRITDGNSSIGVSMFGTPALPVIIPGTQETKTYLITATDVVTKVSVASILINDLDCKETDSKTIGSQ